VYKVVITDSDLGAPDPEKQELEGLADLVIGGCRSEEEIIEKAADADGLLVQYLPITRRVIESLTRCRAISRYGIGYDCIDVEAATERGIFVTNVPDYCVDEVSDHASALILALMRKVVALNRSVRRGTWALDQDKPIYRARGKILGLIGFGKLGRRTAAKMSAFGFSVLVYDPYVPDSEIEKAGFRPANVEAVLAESDVVSLHLPLTAETDHMIGEEQLRAMREVAFLVNTSRGRLIDEAALNRALREGWIAGAAIDVTEQEPINRDNPLLELDNIIITPHAAFYSERSIRELQRRTAAGVAGVLRGEYPDTIVNRGLIPDSAGS